MVPVLVVSTAEPGRTSKDPNATLVIDSVQLIAAAAGVAMQQTVRTNARTGIGSFRKPPTMAPKGQTAIWTGSAAVIPADTGDERHQKLPKLSLADHRSDDDLAVLLRRERKGGAAFAAGITNHDGVCSAESPDIGPTIVADDERLVRAFEPPLRTRRDQRASLVRENDNSGLDVGLDAKADDHAAAVRRRDDVLRHRRLGIHRQVARID